MNGASKPVRTGETALKSTYMATHRVNLDALIVREDFAATEESGTVQSREPVLKVEELSKDRVSYSLLRKPDFQRTTDNWTSEMIVEFVKDFLDDELIPSIIIWHSKETNKVFVIDGAHRMSALIAWANDDYGNGVISQKFYNFDVPKAQQTQHKKTKELMDKEIGSFAELVHLAVHGTDENDLVKVRRGRAVSLGINVQKVGGGAEKAERAFLKINGNPAIIDATELDIIKARRKPNAIATRALIRAGKGYKYWGEFEANGVAIESLAADTYMLLFGSIQEITSQSADVPRAGQPYSAEAFKMVVDLVNVFNYVTDAMWKEPKKKSTRQTTPSVSKLDDDLDGSQTLEFIKRVNRIATLVAPGQANGSIGFDPAVYSYGATGKFHPPAFLASLRFAQKLERDNRLIQFTTVREAFEEFLIRHKVFINQIGHSKGSRLRPVESLVTMHNGILEKLLEARKSNSTISDSEIIAHLRAEKGLKDLVALALDPDEDLNITTRKRFSKAVQAAGVVREVLETRAKCPICKARYVPEGRSQDHKEDVKFGGLGTLDNLQYTHPYCNNSKDQLRKIGFID